jgi:hypothetical protein
MLSAKPAILEQADFYREVAKKARDIDTRTCLEHIARSYEVLAESQEQLERLAKAQELLRCLYRPISN